MPKLITAKRVEDSLEKAKDYIKSYILLPSALLGLVCMVSGIGSLGYQLLTADTYTAGTFYQSSGLLAMGVLFGYLQTRYHRYLFATFPGVLAARMRTASAKPSAKAKKEASVPPIEHRGRALVPVAYVLGALILLAASALAAVRGDVDAVPAFLMPWAGFYWARLFFWRSVLK